MANEYDQYNEPATSDISLKDALYNILNGFQDKEKLRETGEGLTRLRQSLPGVAESVGRGAIAAVPGVVGDISEFGRTWAPEVMEKKFGKERFFPTTREILDYVPRMTPTHEGASTLEDVALLISPGVGGVTKDIAKLTKGVPIGLTIQDVSKTAPIVKETEKLASEIDELGFHSPLENAILKIQQPKGTGDQFLKQLEKTPGVKTEELDVTGVKQYLLDHPNVTKQELLDHMKNSRLKLENKVLGEATGETAEDYQLHGGDVYHDQDYIDATAEDLHYQLSNDADIYHQEQEALVDRFPELYKGHENEPDVAARLNQHVEENIKELADTQAKEMYYDNPIRHYYDDHGYDIYGNDEFGYSFKDPQGRFLDIGGNNGVYDISDAEAQLRGHLLDEGIIDIGGDGAKYEDYTLPGNYSNYREVLTTLPSETPIDKANKNLYNFWAKVRETNPMANDLDSLTPQQLAEYDKLNKIALKAERYAPTYQSSHFDEPNILAHTRLNDRIINGKKTLMVEEIQSDWHQAGRKKGYDTSEVRQNIAKERQKLLDQKDYYAKLAEPYAAEGKDSPREIVDGWTKAANGLQELQKVENSMGNAVPNAPFKKNWHELMMKQILNEAVKGDYDAIAFTTGKQQAERYNLQKHVNLVSAMPVGNGKYHLYLEGKDGDPLFRGRNGFSEYGQKTMTPEEIEETVGKDVAKKLIEGKPNEEGWVDVRDSDLAIGGEGMKGFYDKILPDFVNKYGKKYGIAVKKEHLSAGDNNYSDFREWVIKQDPSLHESYIKDLWEKKGDVFQDYRKAPDRKGDEVHYFDLSDMAKKDIKEKGQPLFSGIGLAAPALMPEDQDKRKK